jgi:hypothetical protein
MMFPLLRALAVVLATDPNMCAVTRIIAGRGLTYDAHD